MAGKRDRPDQWAASLKQGMDHEVHATDQRS